MAFNNDNLSNTGGTSSGPVIYTYETTDTKTEVLTAGYFNDACQKLRLKDLITVVNTDEVYTLRVTAVDVNSVTVQKTPLLTREHAEYHLPVGTVNVAVNDDGVTFTQIPGMVLGFASSEFTVSSGTLVYNGVGGRFVVNGTSDLEVNKAADVTYSMNVNGTPLPSEQTVTSFTSTGKKRNISITGIIELNTGDQLRIDAKGDGTLSVQITVNKLDVTFVEI